MCSTYPGIKLELALQRKEDKIENLSSSAGVVRTTSKQVISSRRRREENNCELYKNEIRTFKTTVFFSSNMKICCLRRRAYLSSALLPPQGFGPDGQNPRRLPRGARVLGRKISQYQKKSRFFKNRARKVLPKSSQGIAETSLGVEETLEGVWERSLCAKF